MAETKDKGRTGSYLGVPKYAKTGFACLECGKWLKVGVRKANQKLCTNDGAKRRENGTLKKQSKCQKAFYNKRKVDARVRADRNAREAENRKPKPPNGIKNVVKKRLCLRCGCMFKSLGIHNRICEKCKAANDRGTVMITREVQESSDFWEGYADVHGGGFAEDD